MKRKKVNQRSFRSCPKVGEVFELTLDGDTPGYQPLAIIDDDYRHQYEHQGPIVKGAHTRKFKLISLDLYENFGQLKLALRQHGQIPEGQWLKVFYDKFGAWKWRPEDTQDLDIGVADASWIHLELLEDHYPCIRDNKCESSIFRFNFNGAFGRICPSLWLMEVRQPKARKKKDIRPRS